MAYGICKIIIDLNIKEINTASRVSGTSSRKLSAPLGNLFLTKQAEQQKSDHSEPNKLACWLNGQRWHGIQTRQDMDTFYQSYEIGDGDFWKGGCIYLHSILTSRGRMNRSDSGDGFDVQQNFVEGSWSRYKASRCSPSNPAKSCLSIGSDFHPVKTPDRRTSQLTVSHDATQIALSAWLGHKHQGMWHEHFIIGLVADIATDLAISAE